MAGTQAWIWRSWFEQSIWLWISINFGALLAALLISVSIIFISVSIVDVLQDNLYIFLILGFGATLSLIQWLVLRQQVIFPVLWSVANVIIGLFAWDVLVKIFSHNSWRFLVLSIVTGVTAGVVSSILINIWGRS